MKINHIISILLTMFFFTTIAYGQTNKTATDYLSVPGPVVFEKISYNLSWSSHPNDVYYKQEYIAKGDVAEKFKTMVFFDVIAGETNVKDVVAAKVAELKKMKETNPVVNYEAFDNPKSGEYMLDFLLSENMPDGNLSIVERNVYRYRTFTDKSGKKGILLFAVSTRSYGKDIDNFFTSLKSNRKDLINAVAQFNIPAISIKK